MVACSLPKGPMLGEFVAMQIDAMMLNPAIDKSEILRQLTDAAEERGFM